MKPVGPIMANIVANLMQDRCERCGEDIEEMNLESWETTGLLLCAGCAYEAFEEAAEECEQ